MQESLTFLNKEIQKNQNIIVACSGGPDSMALLYLTTLVRLNKNINIICAHVNHNVREESKKEALFVKEFCDKNNIIFEQMTIKKYHNDNFHADARKLRYDFFKKIYDKYQANYLLTAHHGDDLIETILMRIVRGSTLIGYAGFNIKSEMNNMTILRPLVFVTKSEIEKYDKEHGISYVIDNSNYKDVYTRNRYRKYILPFLKEENNQVHKKFEQFSQELFLISSFLEKEVHKYYHQVVNNNKINISLFLKCDIVIRKEILKQYLLNYYGNDIEKVTKKHVDLLLDIINNKKVNNNIIFPNKMVVVKENNFIYLTKNINKDIKRQVLKTPFVLEDNHVIKKIKESNQDSNDICRLDSKEISLPLYIRKRKPGDKMMVKNMKGHKNINDIFMEHHIHPLKRDSYPIVEDEKGNIVWIPNLKKSQFNKTKTEKYDIILKYY